MNRGKKLKVLSISFALILCMPFLVGANPLVQQVHIPDDSGRRFRAKPATDSD